MADQTPTSTDAFSSAVQPKTTITFSDYEKFQIQQDAKRASVSSAAAGRPFNLTIGGK